MAKIAITELQNQNKEKIILRFASMNLMNERAARINRSYIGKMARLF